MKKEYKKKSKELYEKHKETIELCDCGCHLITVALWDHHDFVEEGGDDINRYHTVALTQEERFEIELSLYQNFPPGYGFWWNFKRRLSFIWEVIRFGEPHTPMVTMSESATRKLYNYLRNKLDYCENVRFNAMKRKRALESAPE